LAQAILGARHIGGGSVQIQIARMADRANQSGSESGSESEGDLQKRAKRENIAESVDYFLGQLLASLKNRNVSEMHVHYEKTFNELSDKYYRTSRWPSSQAVEQQISEEPLFLIVYKELYYRHIFSRLGPTFTERQGSWENYCKLLDLIIDDLEKNEVLSVALPAQWLWDMLDEFVYHYETYGKARNKAIKMIKESDIEIARNNPDVFDTTKVLQYLHLLIKHSHIEEYLTNPTKEDNPGGAYKDESVRLIGYFALMQLLRMHSLLGDYRLALETIECMDFNAEVPLFYKTPVCHLTLYYYVGFAYIMLRRYSDAIRTFSDILVFLLKLTGVNTSSYQHTVMKKKEDQIYFLLLICLALSPQTLDESLEKKISNDYDDKRQRLHRRETLCFEEMFSYSCPKFVPSAPPDYDAPVESQLPNEALHRQLRLFLQEVKQQQFLPTIKSYMKLYTAIKMSKLAQLCDMDEEQLRDQLMCVMHKTRQHVHKEGPPLSGEHAACSEVEFYLDGDMVHINAHKPHRPHAEVFLEQILKFQDILRKMGQT